MARRACSIAASYRGIARVETRGTQPYQMTRALRLISNHNNNNMNADITTTGQPRLAGTHPPPRRDPRPSS